MSQIFISWSGKSSRRIADALRNWLPDLFQQIEVWMSSHDIDAGARWSSELVKRLDKCDFGIICVTKENQNAPWLLFEAGSLAKSTEVAKVVPYLVNLTPADIEFPLAQFQAAESTKSGTLRLVKSINEVTKLKQLPNDRLTRYFERWWPDLEHALNTLVDEKEPDLPSRSDRELLEELLGLVRGNSRGSYVTYGSHNECVRVNSRPFFENGPENIRIGITPTTTVSMFLDNLYFVLNDYDHIPAYEYGITWVLEEVGSGMVFEDLAASYCESRGIEKDNRLLPSVGIIPGSSLRVLRSAGRG